MKKITLFQESFLVAGIMCFDSCGNTIQSLLKACIGDCIKEKLLPPDARIIIDSEPSGLGLHRLTITIESSEVDFSPAKNFHAKLVAKIKEDIIFEVIDDTSKEQADNKYSKTNWINILINLIAMGIIITLALVFPPSILLTASLTAISFLATAFTSREYLLNFFRNLRTKKLANMSTTISLGWFLSLAHTIFHTIAMPLAIGFSMVFMNFLMPIMLIICINAMNEIKRLILEKSKKIQLKGINSLFPQMSERYRCYQLSQNQLEILSHKIDLVINNKNQRSSEDVSFVYEEDSNEFLQQLLSAAEVQEEHRNLLTEGMIIEVKQGECFPVDCILIEGNTVIDASLLTGEPQQSKQLWQSIPAGAINLGQKVTVYATKNTYNSTVNSLLFRSNRARNTPTFEAIPQFAYVYTALLAVGIVAAVFAPVAFGVMATSLIMQNVIGILFSVCPCTIAIAHQLPKLISIHHRSSKGIHLRDESLISGQVDVIHTIVFDKTGTLTTGNSVVESSDIPINSPLWQRIYLLEKGYGREHPLAKAIQKHYETNTNSQLLFDDIKEHKIDEKNRGLSARVQEKLIHIGSIDYLKDNHIIIPDLDKTKIEQGFSAVYVAEDGIYKGVIYVKHEVREGIIEALSYLKSQGKKIIMLTGDNFLSAKGFNKQIKSIFDEQDIYVGQTPQDKEQFLKKLMDAPGTDPKGVWFVGDGLNDAPCCRVVSEEGGVSCAMESSNKTVFFTDVCLNGSLNYLFKHNKLNHSLYQNIIQNQGILIYSTVVFLAFIISFSIAGIAVPPLIPMAIMLSTTLFVLFNAYRNQLIIDNSLDKRVSWPKKLLGSNLSIGLLLGASTLLISSVLVATIVTGGLALPVIAFTAGIAAAFSSICTLSAIGLFCTFILLCMSSSLSEKSNSFPTKLDLTSKHQSNTNVTVADRPIVRELSYKESLFNRAGNRKNNISLQQDINENLMSTQNSVIF
ncbi:HAD-IC family P-type ATPase [Legionella gresilensis]|uniref:HAD-IC family P-type ATPase n=1 Tax=Legionella gresilensis TaxID=91823 RepID=UPI00104171AE|nr:HAD-IC family P-type ATPase [Legionella gresilensis]